MLGGEHGSGPGDYESATPVRWSWFGRFGFRFVFVALLLSVAAIFGPFYLLPLVGAKLQGVVDWMFQGPKVYLGQHVFHLAGVSALPHATDSRDEALDWIRMGLILLYSLAAAVGWSVLDRRRREYQVLAAWLRFVMRLSLVFLLLRYGIFKVFPLQMSPPSLAVLNERVGESSPMTLFWTLFGLRPGYQMLCGAIEVAAALLLFFRRTALTGALLSAFVMSNVLIFNLFFDVPVKLGAAVMLLLTVAVIAPDLRSLLDFFWFHRQARLTGVWVPPAKRQRTRVAIRVVETAFLIVILVQMVPFSYRDARQQRETALHPSPFTGEWRLDAATGVVNGRKVSLPPLTGEGSPMTALFLEPNGQAMVRSSDGRLWRANVEIDPRAKTVTLGSYYFDGEHFAGEYAMQQPEAEHLVLTPTGDGAGERGTLEMTRVPLLKQYPLLQRRFQWVNEWALER